MRKFECNSCEADCELTMQMDELTPSYCLYDKEKANWHEVVDSAENAQTTSEQFGISEQLPDWVKVGEWVYNIEKKQYQTISLINGTVTCKNIDSEGCTQYGYGAFMSDCVESRKRPFNADEMKALVGKVLRGDKFDYCALITYTEAEMIETQHYTYTSDELIDGYTIDGKPCYKLEHLENGEWVE